MRPVTKGTVSEEELRKVIQQLHTAANNALEYYIVVIVAVNDCQHK